jgi:hypothetical protein
MAAVAGDLDQGPPESSRTLGTGGGLVPTGASPDKLWRLNGLTRLRRGTIVGPFPETQPLFHGATEVGS